MAYKQESKKRLEIIGRKPDLTKVIDKEDHFKKQLQEATKKLKEETGKIKIDPKKVEKLQEIISNLESSLERIK